jgi:hypothetical protein
MGYIFVSYSRQQLYFAESVVLHLQQAGLEVWFDLQQISPGKDWMSELEQGYGNCERLILIVSRAAIQSPYVKIEWETALHDGREIILVLAESVNLPDALRMCAVYDARNQFDRALRNLIAYLCDQHPARHDPIPAPRWRNYPMKMPLDIWLTLIILLMVSYIELMIKYTSTAYVSSSNSRLSFLEFWQHRKSETIMSGDRLQLLSFWILAPLIFYTFIFFLAFGEPGVPASYLFPICFLAFIGYWIFRVWRGSPDIIRWLPPDVADQEMRERVTVKLLPKQLTSEAGLPYSRTVLFALHYHPADRYNAEYIECVLQAGGCQPAPEGQATVQIILVSNRTSKQWLIDRNAALAGQIINMLITNINSPPEIQFLRQTQWFDFRSGRVKTLQAFRAYLTQQDRANLFYALQVTPTGLNSAHSTPQIVRYVAWFLIAGATLISMAGILFLGRLGYWGWFDLVAVLFWILMVGYTTRVLERDACLPSFFHKSMGHLLAWFASPAPSAPDAIGNFVKPRDRIIY